MFDGDLPESLEDMPSLVASLFQHSWFADITNSDRFRFQVVEPLRSQRSRFHLQRLTKHG